MSKGHPSWLAVAQTETKSIRFTPDHLASSDHIHFQPESLKIAFHRADMLWDVPFLGNKISEP